METLTNSIYIPNVDLFRREFLGRPMELANVIHGGISWLTPGQERVTTICISIYVNTVHSIKSCIG